MFAGRNHVEYPTRADVIQARKNLEGDVSSARLECEEENTCITTVMTVGQADTDFTRNVKSTSKGNSFQSRSLYVGRRLSIHSLLRSFLAQKTLTMVSKENMVSTIRVYKAGATLYKTNETEKHKAILIMLSKDDLLYQSSHVNQRLTLEDATDPFHYWYRNADISQVY